MAINNDLRDDGLHRDPRLARLLASASGEEPPSALDAAILAAARREVRAGPQVVSGGGGVESAAPPVRGGNVKCNWYVPMSIAAVLVLSVSLVRVMQEEKGDELSQPPAASRSVPKAAPAAEPTVAAPAAAPTVASPAAERNVASPTTEPAVAASAKPDAQLRDAVPANSARTEERRGADAPAAKVAEAARAPEAYADLARKQRAETNVSSSAGVAAPASPATPAPERRPEAFPAVREREAPAAAAIPAPAPPPPSRDDVARMRSEADRAIAPQPKMAAAPPRAAPADDLARSAPAREQPTDSQVGGVVAQQPARSVLAPRGFTSETITAAKEPSAPSAASEGRAASAGPPAAVIAAKPALTPRPPVWRGLEDQPPEKWLERLADFKRDNRQADADELLAEFRRRFPGHPAAAR